MFKALFKHYKNKITAVDENEFEKSLVPGHLDCRSSVNVGVLAQLGLTSQDQWKLYNHSGHPGLILLRNIFTSEGQWYWIRRCIVDYPSPPNPNNLHQIGLLSNSENWFDVCSYNLIRKESIFRKLRWVTLGYHHNWDTKVYSEENKGTFPDDLALLSQTVAKATTGENFTAQAAIVNYYYNKSTINGHVDHSETNVDASLLSFSFGHSALFLIGGSQEDEPVSLVFIKSGDVVIMSGPTRLSIHGVPRIIPATEFPWECANASKLTHKDDNVVLEYISEARVNMNVRQVLHSGDKSLNE